MNLKNLKSSTKACEDSLTKLKESLEVLEKNEADKKFFGILADAAIKRFEVAFEYSWKLMKAAVEYQGAEAFGPRPAIQEAIRFGYIKSPESWAQALDARNASVHDYFGITVVEYLKIIRRFVKETEPLIEITKKIN